jgi:tetratricopeptide (TPR) repeat protein
MPDPQSTSLSNLGNYNAQNYGSGEAVVTIHQYMPPQPTPPVVLDDALQQLAALPLEAIPDVAPLPPGSYMPLKPNPLFVGREHDLRVLASALKGGETIVINHVEVTAATGLGGIGKTQLASEFVHRYGPYFAGGAFWLSFADANAVQAEIVKCHHAVGLEVRLNYDSLPLEDQVRLVTSAWESPLPRLLVFDNCEDEELFHQWCPRTGGCRVLVTSRKAVWSLESGIKIQPLGVLSRAESIELLRKYRSDLTEKDLEAIAKELGDLPFALSLAGSFLKKYQHTTIGTPEAYLEHLRKIAVVQHISLQGKGSMYSPTRHEMNVERTFALSYDQLDETDPIDKVALALLVRAACFAPGDLIPRALLKATLEDKDKLSPEEELQIEDALERLVSLSLLENTGDGALRLHRLLALFIRLRSGEKEAEAQSIVEKVLLEKAQQVNKAGYPLQMLALQSHLQYLIEGTQQRQSDKTASLCHELGVHFKMMGAYEQAQSRVEQALAIRQQVLEAEHPDIAASLNALGEIYQEQGKYELVEPLYQQALATRRQVLGPEHPDTGMSLNNLGILYQDQGKYRLAEPLLQQALAIRQQSLGPEHPDTAISLNNLAGLYQDQGKYELAEPLLQQALAIRQQSLGPEHPDIAVSLNNLALLYRARGKYELAESLLQQALAIDQQTLGPEHPDTATVLNNIAGLYQAQGKYGLVEPLLQQVLAIRRRILGPEHPDIAMSLNNLAELYRSQGKYELAEPLLQQALAIYQQVLGPEHPDTAMGLNNLAELYRSQGKYQLAEPLLQQALVIRRQALGPEHPDTAMGLNNLAELYQAQGRYEQAEPLYQQALVIYQQILGPENPDTATGLNNLAELYRVQGKYELAKPLYQQALAIYQRALGPEHPNVAKGLNNLGGLYQTQGEDIQIRYTKIMPANKYTINTAHTAVQRMYRLMTQARSNFIQAEPLYQKALAIQRQALGPDHPDVATSLSNLALLYQAQGKYEQARPLYQQALAIQRRALGPDHPDVAKSLSNLAGLHQAQGKSEQAESLLQQALAIQRQTLGSEHPDLAKNLSNIAGLYQEQGKYELAEPLYQQALAIYRQSLGSEHSTTKSIQHDYESLLRRIKRQ